MVRLGIIQRLKVIILSAKTWKKVNLKKLGPALHFEFVGFSKRLDVFTKVNLNKKLGPVYKFVGFRTQN